MLDNPFSDNVVPLSLAKLWSPASLEKVIPKSKGEIVNIGYGFTVNAPSIKSKLDRVGTYGEAKISEISVKATIVKVEYILGSY